MGRELEIKSCRSWNKRLKSAFSPLLRRYTLEEFWGLPDPGDRSHYDLIGGQLYMVPPPDPPHGSVDSHLNKYPH